MDIHKHLKSVGVALEERFGYGSEWLNLVNGFRFGNHHIDFTHLFVGGIVNRDSRATIIIFVGGAHSESLGEEPVFTIGTYESTPAVCTRDREVGSLVACSRRCFQHRCHKLSLFKGIAMCQGAERMVGTPFESLHFAS